MTPLEKLRALAAAKKADQPIQEVIQSGTNSTDGSNSITNSIEGNSGVQVASIHSTDEHSDCSQAGVNQDENVSSNSEQGTESKQKLPSNEVEQGSEVHSDEDLVLDTGDSQEGEGVSSTEQDPGSISRLAEDHPLKMQLAELEQALTEKLPEFRTILRDIHAKLRQDPDCVTAMSEDEIGSIVQGLIHHANVDVIAPRAMKAAKKASKVPVSASDL